MQAYLTKLTEKEVEEFFNGKQTRYKVGMPVSRKDAAENAVRMPYNDIFEVEEENIVYGNSSVHFML